MKPIAKLMLAGMALLLGACAQTVPPPAQQDISAEAAQAAWARVLQEHVDRQGRVDFAGLASNPQDLETWLTHVATVSPRSHPSRFPTRNAQLAYYIDAYNALAMYGVLRSGVLPEQNVRFFLLRRYVIGGETLSLYAFENDVIRELDEPRIHVALNCMAVSCPRLPQVPWDAARLDQQLDAAAREFFNDTRHVRVNHTEGVVYLSAILDFFREDFLAVAPKLPDYVNRYRQLPIPADYRVAFIPYDWSVNAQPGALPPNAQPGSTGSWRR